MTKLHPEIKEALYDPESVQKAKDVLKYAVDKLLDPTTKQGILSKVRSEYGLTKNPLDSGYLLPDGTMLNYGSWERGEVHEDVNIPGLTVPQFQLITGVIRFGLHDNQLIVSFTEGQQVTEAQWDKLDSINTGNGYYDILKENGMPVKGKSGSFRSISQLRDEINIRNKVYDPVTKKSRAKGTLTIKGDMKKMKKLAKHLAKEHPSTKGKMKILDPKPLMSDDKIEAKEQKLIAYEKRLHERAQKALAEGKISEWKRITKLELSMRDRINKVILYKLRKYRQQDDEINYDPAPKGQKQPIVSKAQRGAMFAEIDRREAKAEWQKRMRKGTSRGLRYDPVKLYQGIPARWFEAMVKGIKNSSDVRNPYAIVKNIWLKLSPETKADIKKREAAGEQFKYNLPLPDDRVTKGEGTLRMVKPFRLAEAQVNVSKKDFEAVKKSGIFKPMKRQDGSTCMVARCKSEKGNVNIFADEV